MRGDDTAELLCNRTLTYSLQYPVEQAPVSTGVRINLDEGDDEDEEEEDYVPSEEHVYRDPSPAVIPVPTGINRTMRGSPIWRDKGSTGPFRRRSIGLPRLIRRRHV